MRTFADRTRSRQGLCVDTAAVWPGHGQRVVAATVAVADADCFRTERGRGLDKATASRPACSADIPPPTRDYFADAESSF